MEIHILFRFFVIVIQVSGVLFKLQRKMWSLGLEPTGPGKHLEPKILGISCSLLFLSHGSSFRQVLPTLFFLLIGFFSLSIVSDFTHVKSVQVSKGFCSSSLRNSGWWRPHLSSVLLCSLWQEKGNMKSCAVALTPNTPAQKWYMILLFICHWAKQGTWPQLTPRWSGKSNPINIQEKNWNFCEQSLWFLHQYVSVLT